MRSFPSASNASVPQQTQNYSRVVRQMAKHLAGGGASGYEIGAPRLPRPGEVRTPWKPDGQRVYFTFIICVSRRHMAAERSGSE